MIPAAFAPRCGPLRDAARAMIAAAGLAAALAATAPAAAQEYDRPTRGRLLYETHCIACHRTQVHWRDQRLARDWPALVAQVRDWQQRAHLGWSEGDIVEVARHLNDTIYRFERPLAALALRR